MDLPAEIWADQLEDAGVDTAALRAWLMQPIIYHDVFYCGYDMNSSHMERNNYDHAYNDRLGDGALWYTDGLTGWACDTTKGNSNGFDICFSEDMLLPDNDAY